jgi:hypothetical protein
MKTVETLITDETTVITVEQLAEFENYWQGVFAIATEALDKLDSELDKIRKQADKRAGGAGNGGGSG